MAAYGDYRRVLDRKGLKSFQYHLYRTKACGK